MNKKSCIFLFFLILMKVESETEQGCSSGMRACDSGDQCIPEYYWCDGPEDCYDSSDEIGCVKMRLSDGPNNYTGRVEMHVKMEWGTLCNRSFDNNVATVICKMLGYTDRRGRYLSDVINPGTGRIWLDALECHGSEDTIEKCHRTFLESHMCQHDRDVSITCEYPVVQEIRFWNGPTNSSGEVAVKIDEEWGSICADGLDDNCATVMCRMLGFNENARCLNFWSSEGGGGGRVWLGNVTCNGTENSVLDCIHQILPTEKCSQNAFITCADIIQGVRLRDGKTSHNGRAEIKFNGVWGTVCDDIFDDSSAAVLCKMMGYRNGGHFLKDVTIDGTGPIWLDDVYCNGSETSIADCRHGGIGVHNCAHDEDVFINCVIDIEAIRLQDGNASNSGRVEIKFGDIWGTVCDDNFNEKAVSVICNMLGFKDSGHFLKEKKSRGTGPIWLDDLECEGNESSLINCSHSGIGIHNCGHDEDVYIVCNVPTPGTCLIGEYRCQNEKCIPMSAMCDDNQDCPGGEDERNCNTSFKCGRRLVDINLNLVNNSGPALTGEFPWNVAIYRDAEYICGGALFTSDTVFTAANCLFQTKGLKGRLIPTNELHVHLGSVNLTGVDRQRAIVSVSTTLYDRAYKPIPPFLGDFAILKLSQKVKFTETIQPICIPLNEWHQSDIVDCFATGWGRNISSSRNGDRYYPKVLQKSRMRLVDMQTCQSCLSRRDISPVFQLCCKTDSLTQDTCYGALGGPLQCVDSKGTWTLRGLLSLMSDGCVSTTNVYINIKYYVDAIFSGIKSFN